MRVIMKTGDGEMARTGSVRSMRIIADAGLQEDLGEQ